MIWPTPSRFPEPDGDRYRDASPIRGALGALLILTLIFGGLFLFAVSTRLAIGLVIAAAAVIVLLYMVARGAHLVRAFWPASVVALLAVAAVLPAGVAAADVASGRFDAVAVAGDARRAAGNGVERTVSTWWDDVQTDLSRGGTSTSRPGSWRGGTGGITVPNLNVPDLKPLNDFNRFSVPSVPAYNPPVRVPPVYNPPVYNPPVYIPPVRIPPVYNPPMPVFPRY